jgi:cobalt/nickel transport protein
LISRRTNYLLIAGVLALMILPLVFVKGEYGGSDDRGIETRSPRAGRGSSGGWSRSGSRRAPRSSLLFAVQAAIGAGVIGYVLGRIHGSAKEREAQKQKAPPRDVAH